MKRWAKGELSSEDALGLIDNVLARNLLALEKNLFREGIARGKD
ncbi:hypothetical protein [Paenibacillus sp. P22]|nr:hypothetical protein [Paenibacillus sp. P22]CDN45964.1 hypothetical protein BN871_JT_00090 [Paenibacillus sp. P22]